MTDTEAVFEHLKHQIDRARDSGTSLQTLARRRLRMSDRISEPSRGLAVTS
jgi:hypothetical protein